MSHNTAQNPVQSHTFTRKNHNPSPPIRTSHQNTHLFAAKPQRFHYSHSQNPGPGTYTKNMQTERTIIRPIVPENKEFLWITDKGRQLFETRSSWKLNLGPAKYMHTENSDSHSNWPKNQRFNYLRTQMLTSVGPGLYDTSYSPKQLPAASSAFKSKTTKSFLAEKISQLLKLKESTINPENGFEPITQQAQLENQHHYQRSSQRKRESPVFASNCQRLPTIQSDKVGPGYYEVDKRTKINQAGKRVITQSRTNRPKQSVTKHESHKIITPGPGAYNQLQPKYLQPSKKPLLGVISKEQRFRKQRSQSSNTPGPADYRVNSEKTKVVKMRDNKPSKGQNSPNRLKGSVVRKIFPHNSESNHSSHTNIYELFRKMQREREAVRWEFEGALC